MTSTVTSTTSGPPPPTDALSGAMSSRRAHSAVAASGARAMVPWLTGIVPFGITIGIAIGESTVAAPTGLIAGPAILAGSAHLAAIELLDGGAGIAVVVATVLIINARLIAYATSMAPHWMDAPRWFRLLSAALLIDPSFEVGQKGYRRHGSGTAGHIHYLAGALVLTTAWMTSLTVGLAMGDVLPAWRVVELVIPLFLVAEVGRATRQRPGFVAALAAAVAAVATVDAPFQANVLIAIVIGVGAAGLVDRSDR